MLAHLFAGLRCACSGQQQVDRRHSRELGFIANSWQARSLPPCTLVGLVTVWCCQRARGWQFGLHSAAQPVWHAPRLSCCPVSAAHLAAEPAAAGINEVLAEQDPLFFFIALNMSAFGAAGAQQQAPRTIAAGVVVLAAKDAVAVQLIPLLGVCCCCWCWCHGCPPGAFLWDSDAWNKPVDHGWHMSAGVLMRLVVSRLVTKKQRLAGSGHCSG